MTCPHCAKENQESAIYCSSCGQKITTTDSASHSDLALWRQFIGPGADYYLERFRLFETASTKGFKPSWHWPAFVVGWLWFLYRKMYMHAAVFLVGALLPMLLDAGLVGIIIWNGFSGLTANFLYYMHVKLNLAMIERRAKTDPSLRERLIADAGGIQPYVWWLGVGLVGAAIAQGILQAPPPQE
jgi:hypothetical protein